MNVVKFPHFLGEEDAVAIPIPCGGPGDIGAEEFVGVKFLGDEADDGGVIGGVRMGGAGGEEGEEEGQGGGGDQRGMDAPSDEGDGDLQPVNEDEVEG